VAEKVFAIFPVRRTYKDFPWQIWAVGWLAVFKAFLWLAYEPNLPDFILRLLAFKYTMGMFPFLIFGIGVWNLKRWAVWGIILAAIADLIFIIVNPQTFSGFLVQSEVFVYSVILSAVTLVCNGPLGDLFLIFSAPTILKYVPKKQKQVL
jgi:hypothetical protein